MPSKKAVAELLGKIARKEISIDEVKKAMETTRKVEMTETAIAISKGMTGSFCYFVKGNKIWQLPLQKVRSNGKKAEFVPYYRTANQQ